MTEFTTRLIPLPLVPVLLAIAVAAVLALYRRERAAVAGWRGVALVVLRIGLVGCLVGLLADPCWIRHEERAEPGEVFVVVDTSKSMTLEDPPRRERILRALRDGWLRDLSQRFRVSILTLDADLNDVELETIPPAGGPETRLELAFSQRLARARGRPTAGVVVWTDGNDHGSRDIERAATTWAATGVPWIAIGVGVLREPSDLSIETIDATGTIFADDEVTAQVVLRASGIPAGEVRLGIREGAAEVGEETVAIPDGGGRIEIPVRFPAGVAGRKKLTFSAPPLEGDTFVENNARDLWLDVRSQEARVLFIDSGPRWEEIYLRAAWTRDPKVQLDGFRLEPPPARGLPEGFPRTREALFEYDAVVIGDVRPTVFAKAEIDILADYVEAHGGTLILLSGPRAMPRLWRDTRLGQLLPVEILSPPPPWMASTTTGTEGFPLTLTQAGQTSELTRIIAGRERNAELWELLPAPTWLNPVGGVRPGGEVLVTVQPLATARLPGIPPGIIGAEPPPPGTPEAQVLEERGAVLVTRPYGAGRLLYVGHDETWRWRYRFGDELFERFWSQVIRWAVSRRLIAQDAYVRLGTDRALYASGQTVVIEARIQSGSGSALQSDLVDAVLSRKSDAKEGRVRLEPVARSGGRYRGSARLEDLDLAPVIDAGGEPAAYDVALEIPDLPGYAGEEPRATVDFVVEPPQDLESRDLACDVRALEDIARRANGTYLPFSRFAEAESYLKDTTIVTTATTETRPVDRPLLVAAALLSLLVVEWVLRKRLDLL